MHRGVSYSVVNEDHLLMLYSSQYNYKPRLLKYTCKNSNELTVQSGARNLHDDLYRPA